MVKEFNYTSHNETKLRKLFVIKDTQFYIEGIDLNLLPSEEANEIVSRYKDFTPLSNRDDKVQLDGFNPMWNKAYRQFVKSKIII